MRSIMKSCLINISFHFVDIQICHFQTGLDHLTVYAMGRRKRMFGNVTGTYSGEWSGGEVGLFRQRFFVTSLA